MFFLRFESAREVLSDKSHLRYMKGVGLDLINYDEYDDEYDDTYDSHNIGSLDQEENDETFIIKRYNVVPELYCTLSLLD